MQYGAYNAQYLRYFFDRYFAVSVCAKYIYCMLRRSVPEGAPLLEPLPGPMVAATCYRRSCSKRHTRTRRLCRSAGDRTSKKAHADGDKIGRRTTQKN